MGQNLSRKTAAEKHIFLSYLNLSKKSEKLQAYRGWKVAVTVKISAHLELQNKNEKSNRAQTPCMNKISDIEIATFFQTKMGKTWHFIKNFRN